ncbi:hydrolase [Streptomyces dangxiongensis]|uniref:Hydrolase n=1 Tax=Streptomyces dangxiongensis TaxID=1442032 RepID=A0A3G2JPF7_9ACTN|nr:ricin-type beta-trefoil lectin domain protein [Streptomyces dangxiongensis]AYN42489.1 hydrolase [Streptomyces dangxiongensis]
MPSPHPPRPPFPPPPAPSGESDRALVARLTGPGDARHHAVALLLARHWRPTRDHAVICLASAGYAAQLVATAAFHQVLGRMAGGVLGGALRPQLLVAVRDTVRSWAADEAARIALPELRKPTGGRGLRATNPETPESRQLAARAFQALPGASQCLLWHTEVEAEPINIPAGLLGIDPATAIAALEQAREQFRAACVRAHRELAPSSECRLHNRLLDVTIRRGGTLPPDVRRHLTACDHCRYAAEQLGHFDGGLHLLLAETVLGWGARRYLDSRPGRAAPGEWPPPPAARPAPPVTGGRHRTGPENHRRTAVAVGVGLTSLALLATVLAARSWSDDNGVPASGATWGAPGGDAARPGGTGTRSAAPPSTASAASAGESAEIAQGALRGLGSRLCLDVRGNRVAAGAGVRLAPCSSAASQQWSYRDDGLLRSAAAPSLCLTADPGTRRVELAGCHAPTGEVSYDVTVRGEILLRRRKGLALTPGSGRSTTRVAVAERDGSPEQRWVLEPGTAEMPRSRSGADAEGEGASEASGVPGAPDGQGPSDGTARAGSEASSPAGAGPDSGRRGDGDAPRGEPDRGGAVAGQGTEPRIAQVHAEEGPRRGGAGRAGRTADAVLADTVLVDVVLGDVVRTPGTAAGPFAGTPTPPAGSRTTSLLTGTADAGSQAVRALVG